MTGAAPDVVVVGAGPTGLMLAAELRLAGVGVAVLERLPEPTGESRSLGLNPRAVELWSQRDVIDRFGGPRFIPRGHYGALPVSLDFTRLDSPYGVMMMPQSRTEQVLGQWASDLGAEIRRGHELVSLSQDADGVDLGVRTATGEYPLRAGWVVGCDGSRSAVRTLAGIGFPGAPSTVDVVMVDISGVDGLELRLFERTEHGLWAVFPVGPDMFRVVIYHFSRPPVQNARRHAQRPSFAEVCEVAGKVAGLDLSGGTPHWVSRHGNTTRIADRFADGRILLVGDAAHVQPPAGGMALTSGLGDAVNLGWKLAAEINGWAPPGLLDSYVTERYPVAERVIMHTRVQNLLMSGGLESAALRTLLTELLGFAEVNDAISAEVSSIGFRYPVPGRAHPLLGVRLPPCALRTGGGMRFAGSAGAVTDTLRLLRSARGLLLDLGAFAGEPVLGGITARWSGRVDALTATLDAGPAASALAETTALLVRPDGHVVWTAARGAPPDKDELDDALHRWFGEPVG